MKKTICKAKVWLIPVLFVIALCMGALAVFAPPAVKAEAPVYEVTGIEKVVETADTNNNTFYVNATSTSDSITGTWYIQYGGAAKKNGEDITITFRVIKEDNRTLYFEGVAANEGDVISVGGVYSITNVIDGCPVTVAIGDYSVSLESAEFVYKGGNVWEKAKEKVDELPSANIFLDANGTDLWLSGQHTGVQDNTDNGNWWGLLPGSEENLKVSYTSNAISDGETIQVNLAKRYKASNFATVNVKMLIGAAAGVVHTAYATADTEFATPAGAVSTANATEAVVFEINASKIADSEGYFDSFVIKRTGGSAGQVFVDYVELVPDKKDDTVYTESVVLDANGTDVAIEGCSVVNDNEPDVFGNDGSTKMIYTGGIADGGTVTVTLGKKYLARNFASLKVRMVVGSWGDQSNVVTNTAFATSDTGFTAPAGTVQTGHGNVETILEINAAVLADSEGYISSFVIRKTETFSVSGQLFFDYVELVPDKKDDTEYKQNVVLPIDGNSVAMDNGTYGEDTFGVMSDDKTAIVASTAEIGNNTAIKFTFKTKYKAANFSTVSITIGATNWTANNVITTTMYALTDTGFAVPLASATNSAEGFGRATITANAEALADNYGYIGGFYLVKTQTGTAAEPDPKWQFFAGAVTLNVPSYTMMIIDGDTTVKNVVKGEAFKMSDIGAVNSATHIVAGYKINGKLYSKDYTFVPAADTEIEVIRVAFRVLDGAYIKYAGKGLRFVLFLSEADYEAVKAIVSEENISFGVIMIKINSDGSDGTIRVKAAANYYLEDGNIKFNGLITEIPETAEAYTTQFRAGGYLSIKYEDKTDATMIYANEPAAEYKIRSIYDVAKAAIAAGGLTGEALEACETIVGTVDLSSTNLPDYNEKKKDMSLIISGWLIPKGLDYNNAKWIKEAGLDVLFAVPAGSENTIYFDAYDEEAKRVLDILDANGVKVYINTLDGKGEDGNRTAVGFQKVAQFQHNAVLGMVLDEPNKTEIDNIAAQVDFYNQYANGKNLYVNLFPSFAPALSEFSGLTAAKRYEQYLEYFCENVLSKLTTGEKWLSVDRYPLTYDAKGNKCLDAGWLADVQAVAKVAQKYEGIKTNFFIQTMPYGADSEGNGYGAVEGSRDRVPTIEDIRLQEMALMAFGFDGISMFCYGTPVASGEFSSDQVAMIDREWNKTDIYEAVKQATSELKKFDHVLLQFDYQSTFTNDGGKTVTSSTILNTTSNASFKNLDRVKISETSSIKSLYTSQDTLFGYFKDVKGNEGFVAVNYNDTSKKRIDTVEITFDSAQYNAAVCYIRGEQKIIPLTNGKLTLELGVGEGVFVIPCQTI